MEQEEEAPVTDISENFNNGHSTAAQGVKQFSECECDKPIVEPVSYVLPDQQFISLLHCKACNGLSRYSVTELPHDNDEDTPQNKLDTVDSLLEDINALKAENERLQEKLHRQSRRMRMAQGSQIGGREGAVINPIADSNTQEDQTTTEENQRSEPVSNVGFNRASISSTGRKVLLVSLVLGVGLTGSVVWTSSTLSATALVIGTLLITIPVFFLTDGGIPQSHKE